jgi:hypothetical protein
MTATLDFATELATRLGIGLLLFAAGVSKMLRQRSMPIIVARYRLLPSLAVRPFAYLLGPTETILGFALLCSPWYEPAKLACPAAVVLLMIFSGAVAIALFRGISVECGCGLLVGDYVTRPRVLARNLLLAVMLCWAS